MVQTVMVWIVTEMLVVVEGLEEEEGEEQGVES